MIPKIPLGKPAVTKDAYYCVTYEQFEQYCDKCVRNIYLYRNTKEPLYWVDDEFIHPFLSLSTAKRCPAYKYFGTYYEYKLIKKKELHEIDA